MPQDAKGSRVGISAEERGIDARFELRKSSLRVPPYRLHRRVPGELLTQLAEDAMSLRTRGAAGPLTAVGHAEAELDGDV